MKVAIRTHGAWKQLRRGCALLSIWMALTEAGASTDDVQATTSAAAAGVTDEFQAILATVPTKSGKVYGVERLDLEALSEEKRNELAVATAKALAEQERFGEWLSLVNQKPRRGSFAADLLVALSNKGYITTPDVIPHLIERMKHADNEPYNVTSDLIPYLVPNYIAGKKYQYCWNSGMSCLRILAHLTQHQSGLFGRQPEDFEDDAWRRRIIDWWEKWWTQNKSQHPLFDTALEKRTRQEVWLARNLIAERLGPRFPQLFSSKVPKEQPLGIHLDYPLFVLDYYPGLWNSIRSDMILQSEEQSLHDDPKVRIIIHARFGMKDLRHPEDRTKAIPDDFNSPEDDRWPKELGKQLPVKTVFAKRLGRTDIIIEVKLATQDRKLASAMRTTLKELCSPGDEDLSGEYDLLTSPLMLALYVLGGCAVVIVVVRIRRQKRPQQ